MEGLYSGVDILEALESADFYNDFLTGLIRKTTKAKQLIDFGAGLGTFSKRLRQVGYQVLCIEPDDLQRQGLAREGFQVLSAIGGIPDNSAPFVFALNVFEHIEDHEGAIKQIRRKLQPGGTLLIYVPAFNCLWTDLDDKVCHHRRYTCETLRQLVLGAGLTVEQLRYADSLGFIAALVFRLLGRRAETLTKGSISFYDRWIFRPSQVLDRLFHSFFGKNVFVICRK
jgi:SAM-dependent methyltransferase